MARKKIRRPLLPLRGNLKVAGATHRVEQLADILRKTARAQQTDKAQVFYALREVADRFDISLSMVATVYRQLESEGLLTRLRGSRTLLQGLRADREVSVHGIVGVPMPLSSFLTRQKSRMFFMSVRRELRRRGFATAGLFYEKVEARPDFLFERIKHCNVDSVLWYMPDRCARDTALLLRDNGVRVIGVADGGLPALSCRFEISREKAITEILRDWKVRGCCWNRPALVPERGREASRRRPEERPSLGRAIRKVKIIRSLGRSATDEERLETLLESERLGHEFISAEDEGCEALLRSLAEEDDESGIILLGAAASFFAFRAPARLIALMNRRRVALVDGPVSLPFINTAPACADLAVADWEAVANGITEAFLTKEAFDRASPTVFEATAFLQAPLSEFTQAI
ncbi:MAG: hypothetical protein V7609_1632 [Verrucomicrobiota bacterium]